MNIFEIPVHPAADIFPMLLKDELQELADDIEENGLIHPLIVKDGVLIDGRNRREACKIHGIEPTTQELNGEDPEAYIISSNVHRRQMNKGQQAMAVAMVYPNPEKGGRGKNSKVTLEFSSMYLSQARTVLSHTPDLAKRVLAGSDSLDKAYKQALEKKKSHETFDARFKRIQEEIPEVARMIQDGDLSLEAGEAELKKRDEEKAAQIASFNGLMRDILAVAAFFPDKQAINRLSEMVEEYGEQFNHATVEDLPEAFEKIKVLRDHLTSLLEENL